MFEGEAYRSYIDLMRELRLERQWREADLWLHGDDPTVWTEVNYLHGLSEPPYGQKDGYPIWLPRLDQWLQMLEEAGYPSVAIQRIPVYAGNPPYAWSVGLPSLAWHAVSYPTREEACARLWMMAVTGKTGKEEARPD